MILINRGQDPLATIFYEKRDNQLLKNLIKKVSYDNGKILSHSSLGLSNHLIRS